METLIKNDTNSRKVLFEAVKTEICYILQITEEQYCYFQYEQGLSYLKMYYRNNAPMIDRYQRSRLFWCWWKNLWAAREEAFISCSIEMCSLTKRKALYVGLHDVYALIGEIYLSDTLSKQIIEQC